MPEPQPNTPNAQAAVDGAGAGGTEAVQASEAAKSAIDIAQLSQALGREFKSPDDALKALTHLNSLVGDRTIQDLRKKAEAHDTFEQLVAGYAKEEGVSAEEARKHLSDLARNAAPKRDERVDKVLDEVSNLKLQLAERDFIAEHPEAKSVLKELKALAGQTGQTLAEAYESSSLKDLVTKAAASEERARMGTTVRPSGRSGVPNDKVKAALDRLKTDKSPDAQDEAVRQALGL